MIKYLHNFQKTIPQLFYLFLISTLVGCGPASTSVKEDTTEAQLAAEAEANQFILIGDYTGAADAFLELAETNPGRKTDYQLKAAAALLEAEELTRASEILSSLPEQELGNKAQLQKSILESQLALRQRNPAVALELLAEAPAESTPVPVLVAYRETRAQAFEQLAEYSTALEERRLAVELDTPNQNRNIDQQSLWQLLKQVNPESLAVLSENSGDMFKSWVELAVIARHQRQPAALNESIQLWQGLYPGHVANSSIIPDLLAEVDKIHASANTIAILLPLEGKFRPASLAIQEGLMAAWNEDNNAEKPRLLFYSSDSLNINEVYQQAIADGAEFIIGPLEKAAVDKLVNSSQATIRTMALNSYDGLLNDNSDNGLKPGVTFFQFALAPEDEAAQVAEQAIADGHLRALTITPGNPWGQRVLEAFRNRFESLGGTVLENAVLADNGENFSSHIISLLNTDDSKERAKQLRDRLRRKLESETRRRQDADFIFLATQPDIARQVVPHIYFQRASDLPVYATSHIYSSTPNAELDRDMNNIQFIDIPWIIDPATPYSNIRHFMQQKWQYGSATIKRLFALGIDAYLLVSKMSELNSNPDMAIAGTTGALSLGENGQVKRKMSWSKFQNGIPEMINQEL